MSHREAAVVIWLGGLGLGEFGGLWLAATCLGANPLEQAGPLLAVVSAGLVIAGVVLCWTGVL